MGCWDSFTLFCGRAGIVVAEAVDILDKLANQAKLIMNALILSGAIDANDDRVIEAFDFLTQISGGLKISAKVAEELIKYIPKNLKDIPDLNQDGDINVKDMIELLKSGHKVLDQFIKSGLIDNTQALIWSKVFTNLINVLNVASPRETFKGLLARGTGVRAVPEQQIAPQSRKELLKEVGELRRSKQAAVEAYHDLHATHKQTVSALRHLTITHEQTVAFGSTRQQQSIQGPRMFVQQQPPQQQQQQTYYYDEPRTHWRAQ